MAEESASRQALRTSVQHVGETAGRAEHSSFITQGAEDRATKCERTPERSLPKDQHAVSA
jgi:hypothetical protein